MNYNYLSLSEESKINALTEYSMGNTDALFEIIFSSVYRKNEIISNPDFIFNIISNSSENLKDKFFNLLIDHPRVSDNYLIKNDKSKKKDKKFWGSDIEKPLLFCLIPYLTDSQSAQLIAQSNIYSMIEHPDSVSNREKILIKLFEHQKIETIKVIKKNYIFLHDIDFKKEDNSIILEKKLSSFCHDNYELAYILSQITYQNQSDFIKSWIKKQTAEKNELNIKNFIEKDLLNLDLKNQELAVCVLASEPITSSLVFTAIKKMGFENIKQYKPIDHPLWENLSNNLPFCKKLLSDGLDPFEFHEKSNTCFFSQIKNHYPSINLEKSLIWQKLSSSYTDSKNKTTVNFSVLCSSYETAIFETLNQNLSNLEMKIIDKKFKDLSYDKLDDIDKIIVIETLMDKTWFSESYKTEYSYKKMEVDKTQYAIEAFFVNQYYFQDNIWQINEHLDLLDKLHKSESIPLFIDNPSFQKKYFKTLKTLITSNAINNLTEQNNCYLRIISYIKDNKNLPWTEISDLFNLSKVKEEQISDMGKNICSYLKKVCLSHALPDKKENIPKIKI